MTNVMDFGGALQALKSGRRVSRKGWNGKGMWLVLVGASDVAELKSGTPYALSGLHSVSINAHIDMMTAQGAMQPGWLASQTDMLAEDWIEVSE